MKTIVICTLIGFTVAFGTVQLVHSHFGARLLDLLSPQVVGGRQVDYVAPCPTGTPNE